VTNCTFLLQLFSQSRTLPQTPHQGRLVVQDATTDPAPGESSSRS